MKGAFWQLISSPIRFFAILSLCVSLQFRILLVDLISPATSRAENGSSWQWTPPRVRARLLRRRDLVRLYLPRHSSGESVSFFLFVMIYLLLLSFERMSVVDIFLRILITA